MKTNVRNMLVVEVDNLFAPLSAATSRSSHSFSTPSLRPVVVYVYTPFMKGTCPLTFNQRQRERTRAMLSYESCPQRKNGTHPFFFVCLCAVPLRGNEIDPPVLRKPTPFFLPSESLALPFSRLPPLCVIHPLPINPTRPNSPFPSLLPSAEMNIPCRVEK